MSSKKQFPKGRVNHSQANRGFAGAMSRFNEWNDWTLADRAVMLAVSQLTVSYSKPADRVSIAKVASLAGVVKDTAGKSLRKLNKRGVVVWSSTSGRPKDGFSAFGWLSLIQTPESEFTPDIQTEESELIQTGESDSQVSPTGIQDLSLTKGGEEVESLIAMANEIDQKDANPSESKKLTPEGGLSQSSFASGIENPKDIEQMRQTLCGLREDRGADTSYHLDWDEDELLRRIAREKSGEAETEEFEEWSLKELRILTREVEPQLEHESIQW